MRPENKGLRFLFLILDISLLFVAISIISYFNPTIKSNLNLYLLHACVAEIIAYLLYSNRSHYFLDNFKSRIKHTSLRMLVFVFVLFIGAQLFLPSNYSVQMLLQYVGMFYLLKISVLFIIYKYLDYKRSNGKFLHNIAILGLRESDVLLGCLVEKNPTLGFNLVGYIADTDDYDRKDKTIIGQVDEIEDLATKHHIEKMFITPSKYFEEEHARRILAICNKVGLKVRYVMMNTY